MRRAIVTTLAVVALIATTVTSVGAASATKMVGINVVLNRPVSNAILADLATYGKVRDVVRELRAVTVQARLSSLAAIRGEAYVAAANPDAKRVGKPVPSSPFDGDAGGLSTWDLDAINVTASPGAGRSIDVDGTGVYVAVIDSGLLSSWRFYFPEARIATDLARSFGGGGGEEGNVSSQPNKWQTDQNSHGTHVTSTIIGYNFRNTAPINGVAPGATIIPVKVLNQNGAGWSSAIARGIMYVADLKANGALKGKPVVINMSLGGPELDAMEKAAIDYAISKGVIIVAAAGNEGDAGMGYPGAYAPVISAAASGWIGEWAPKVNGAVNNNWWVASNVPDPNAAANFYITDFSSRQLTGQDLDVSAPGSWVVGPYQTNGQLSYYFLGGTSMASPHVAGTVALMLEEDGALTAAQAESILESTALALPAGCRDVLEPTGTTSHQCWGADAAGAGLLQSDAAVAAVP